MSRQSHSFKTSSGRGSSRNFGALARGVRMLALGISVMLVTPAAMLVAAAPRSAHTAAFGCEAGFYQVLTSTLNKLDFDTGQYVAIGTAYTANYNAIGYNDEDGFIYGVTRDGNANILKIAGDGTVTNLGATVPALPNLLWFGGDFDGQGNLYIVDTNGTWRKVDVSEMTAQSLTISGSSAMPDFSIIDGFIYGIIPGSNTLVRIDLSNLVRTQVTVSGLPASTYGASFVSNSTRFFVSNNSSGIIYEVEGYSGNTPTATSYVTATVTSNNDGAACPGATTPGTYRVSFDLGGGTGTTPGDIIDLVQGDVSTLPDGSGFSRTGFDFGGWDCDNDIGEVASGGQLTQPNDDVLCTAIWTPKSPPFVLAFDLGGGTGTTPATIEDLNSGDVSTLPDGSGFSRTGFDFGGWDCDNDIGEVASGGQLTQPNDDVLCTAIWTPKSPPFVLPFLPFTGSDSELPLTGSDSQLLVIIGIIVVALGAVVVVAARRRSADQAPGCL